MDPGEGRGAFDAGREVTVYSHWAVNLLALLLFSESILRNPGQHHHGLGGLEASARLAGLRSTPPSLPSHPEQGSDSPATSPPESHLGPRPKKRLHLSQGHRTLSGTTLRHEGQAEL